MRRETLHVHIVPPLLVLELLQDQIPRLPVVVLLDVRHVLQDEVVRLAVPDHLDHEVEKVAPLRTLQPLLAPGLREWLAGETGAEDIVLRHVVQLNASDVSSDRKRRLVFRRVVVVVSPIHLLELSVDLRRHHALMPQPLECNVEAA